jgi:hypothetical protein
VSAGTAWAAEAIGAPQLGDPRRAARWARLVTALAARPASAVSEACGNWGGTKAAYRFWDNDAVAPAALVGGVGAATARRAAGEPVVLLLQDTTQIAHATRTPAAGLGPLSGTARPGFLLHSTLAATPDGVPLGLLDQQYWVRPAQAKGRKARRRNTPIEEKESAKWLRAVRTGVARLDAQTARVVVADRAADIYELLALLADRGQDFVLRGTYNRALTDGSGKLAAAVAAAPVLGQVMLEVPHADDRPARRATLTLRATTVTLKPSNRVAHATRAAWHAAHPDEEPLVAYPLAPLTVGVVDVVEEAPPPGAKALHWRLLTSLPLATRADAERVVAYYRVRWLIGRFHYVLKQGCTVERLQLETRARLERAVVTYSVVAWRLLWAALAARATPDAPCTVAFADDEWRAVWAYHHRSAAVPAAPPDLGTLLRLVARLGGHLGRAHDGPPGPKTLWRGLRRLDDLVAMWRLHAPPPALPVGGATCG